MGHLNEVLGMDVKKVISENPPSVTYFDDIITAPFFGYENRMDYYRKAACYNRVPDIRIPTVFFQS
jgi:predicted alpha/beta-fold hydrolase